MNTLTKVRDNIFSALRNLLKRIGYRRLHNLAETGGDLLYPVTIVIYTLALGGVFGSAGSWLIGSLYSPDLGGLTAGMIIAIFGLLCLVTIVTPNITPNDTYRKDLIELIDQMDTRLGFLEELVGQIKDNLDR